VTGSPRLSIGLPVYNGEEYLAEALDALLGQTFTDFELIISDNASTDGTATICARYERQDARIRYFRQSRNIGAAPNHNFLLAQARGEFFQWVSCDDLYARDLLQRCVDALDAHPDVILAAAWTAVVDHESKLTQARPYPMASESPSAPVRFTSMLFGEPEDYGFICADDDYGVIRTEVLRRVAPHGSFYHADKALITGLSLYGRFHHERDWLYFRRDHADRAFRANPTARSWCANLDPRRASRLRHPVARLFAEYLWSFTVRIARAPLSPADRLACYWILARWTGSRVIRKGPPAGAGGGPLIGVAEGFSVDERVAGREKLAGPARKAP
jgi:glycosyltransferase involved in cell wall biosynthesis